MKLISIPLFSLAISGSIFSYASDSCFGGKYEELDAFASDSAVVKIMPSIPTSPEFHFKTGCVALSFIKEEGSSQASEIRLIESNNKAYEQHAIKALTRWRFKSESSYKKDIVIYKSKWGESPTSKHFTFGSLDNNEFRDKLLTLGIDIANSKFSSSIESDSKKSKVTEVVEKINKAEIRHAKMVDHIVNQTRSYSFELDKLSKIENTQDMEQRKFLLSNLSAEVEKFKKTKFKVSEAKVFLYENRFSNEVNELDSLQEERLKLADERATLIGKLLEERNQLFLNVIDLREQFNLPLSGDEQQIYDVIKEELRERAELAEAKRRKEEAYRRFYNLGKCELGNSVYHREVWDTDTTSGNVIADFVFNASTKEQFIITYEAVVESFLGSKVKTIINDYKIQQTLGGGFLNPKTHRLNELAAHADKYIGKVQFYEKSRCTL